MHVIVPDHNWALHRFDALAPHKFQQRKVEHHGGAWTHRTGTVRSRGVGIGDQIEVATGRAKQIGTAIAERG